MDLDEQGNAQKDYGYRALGFPNNCYKSTKRFKNKVLQWLGTGLNPNNEVAVPYKRGFKKYLQNRHRNANRNSLTINHLLRFC